jgi:hypothetical protein
MEARHVKDTLWGWGKLAEKEFFDVVGLYKSCMQLTHI